VAKKKRSSSRKRSNASASRRTTIWSVLGAVLLLTAAYLYTNGHLTRFGVPPGSLPIDIADIEIASDGSQPDRAAPPVQELDGDLEVFFTTPYLVYPDVPEERVPPPHEQAIVADINAAQQWVDAALFEYSLASIADALIQAHERGVEVRLALDRENLEDEKDAAWAGRMEEADIPIAWEDSTSFQHSKFFVIDDTIVWTGSWNVTTNGTYRNNNNILRLTIPSITQNYRAEFDQMNSGTFGNDKESLTPNFNVAMENRSIENFFSPRDKPAPRIVEVINGAQYSIRFLTFSFTSDPIGQAMVDKLNAGVAVQGVFEGRNANGTGSEFERLQTAGADVLTDGNCYTMHHKIIIIDDRIVITGSYNFTARAEDTNDENLLIIDDPALAAQYVEEFNRVFEQAQNPTECGG
jgi:phosphatidylserine/phosphatidylglycerophosphate/cardiolipin synthase-like enzyme